jgi:NitT/TauT family transport system ATP-binding protein
MIALHNVTLQLAGRTIVEDVALEVGKGEFVCIVGPSGCGKTTLLRLIAGLIKPTAGQVTYQGATMTAPRREIAIVFQDYSKALLPWRNVSGNIALALEALRVPKSERQQRIDRLLALIGLSKDADKFPVQLSGGMQQRLQIARCLAQDPVVLLMDEPFGALDAMTRQALQDEILGIVAASGATVVFVTHDLEEAIYLGDRVVCMRPHPGRITEAIDIGLPRPRNQLTTRESPEFLQLRHRLFNFITESKT